MWRKLKKKFREIESIVSCAVLYLATTLLDEVSSLNFPGNFYETNPLARHPDGTFWFAHALTLEAFNLVQFTLASAILFVGASVLGKKWAKFAASVPWLYFGWVHLQAAFNNMLLHVPGLYVSIPLGK